MDVKHGICIFMTPDAQRFGSALSHWLACAYEIYQFFLSDQIALVNRPFEYVRGEN